MIDAVVRQVARRAALIALAWTSACGNSGLGDHFAGSRTSPFKLFGRDDMRAGLRFRVLDDAAKKESVQQYQCVPLWAKAKRCSVAVDPGVLTAIVDSTDRVIRLLATTDSVSRSRGEIHGLLIFRDVVRDTRLSWDSVGTLHRDGMDAETPQLRWLDRSGRWGASLWYSRAHRADVRTAAAVIGAELAMSLPESLAVTDLPAYALFMERQPPSPAPNDPVAQPIVISAGPPTKDELLTMLRSDLRALTIAEEAAVHATGNYETQLEKLSISPTPGVRMELVRPTPDGWSAIATHPSLPGLSCVVFAGNVPSPPTTRTQRRRGGPGDIVCDQP